MISTEQHGTTTVLRLEHGKASALDLELLVELESQLSAFEASAQRALVLTGRGRIFCAGVDLFRLQAGGEPYTLSFLGALSKAFRRLYFLRKPAVAAINGHAIAGGCLLALACESRLIAGENASMGVTELNVGVPFPAVALEILKSGLAPAVVEDLLFSGRLCKPVEALRLGLVHRIVSADELMPQALESAARLGSVLPETYAMAKGALRSAAMERMDTKYRDYERAVTARWLSAEVRGEIQRFLKATIGKSSS